MVENIYKKLLDISKKIENTVDNEAVKVPRDEVILTLKVLEGLKRTLLRIIKHA